MPSTATTPESWKALFVVGILFPLHIIAGLLTIPFLCLKLYQGSVAAFIFSCCCERQKWTLELHDACV